MSLKMVITTAKAKSLWPLWFCILFFESALGASLSWSLEETFTSDNPFEANFGFSTAATSNENEKMVAVLGSREEGGDNRGVFFHMYRKEIQEAEWIETSLIEFPLAYIFSEVSISQSGNTVLVASRFDGDEGCVGPTSCGVVYIINRVNSTTWQLQSKIVQPEPQSDYFGFAADDTVSIYNDEVFAAGLIYRDGPNGGFEMWWGAVTFFMRHENGTWVERYPILRAEEPRVSAHFGEFVALGENTIVVVERDASSVIVFEMMNSFWTQVANLPFSGGDFTSSVVISNAQDRFVVGRGFPSSRSKNGIVHIYRRVSGVWGLETVLQPNEERFYPLFGINVDVNDEFVTVGAPPDTIFVYCYEDESWSQVAKLSYASGSSRSLALIGNTLVAGSLGDSAVYILSPGARPTLFPFHGPQVGGTVIQIENIGVLLNESLSIVYCLFDGFGLDEVVDGVLLKDLEAVECVTPFADKQASVRVGFALHDPSTPFDRDTAAWQFLGRRFQYLSADPGIVRPDTPSPLIEVDEPFAVSWSGPAIIESALRSLRRLGGQDAIGRENLTVAVELLAFNGEGYDVVQTTELPSVDLNETEVLVSQELVTEYSDLNENEGDSRRLALANVAIFVVRISVLALRRTPTGTALTRRAAVRTSKKVFAVPFTTVQLCGLLPSKEECFGEQLDELPGCPPDVSYFDFIGPPFFVEDRGCKWPEGSKPCLPTAYIRRDESAVFGISIGLEEELNPTSCSCKFFHKEAAGCWRAPGPGKTGQQCCYYPNGSLIRNPFDGAGTADCVSSEASVIEHFAVDVVPYILCCKTLPDVFCESYYNNRPSDGGFRYARPRPPARGFGEPHFRSFDGVDFDFNGVGEYVAFCGKSSLQSSGGPLPLSELIALCDPTLTRLSEARGTRLSVHFLLSPLSPGDVGTVTVGFGIEDPAHRDGLHAIVVVAHPERRLEVFDGADTVEFPNALVGEPTTTAILSSGSTISRTSDLAAEVVQVVVQTPSGLRVEASETGGGEMLISLGASVDLLNGRVIGLLGLADGNATNDLTNSTGTMVDPASDPSSVFSEFGQSWLIRSSAASLFQGQSDTKLAFDNFYNPDYVPAFVAPPMTAELEQEANAICGGIESNAIRDGCFFDVAATSKPDIVAAWSQAAVQEELTRVAVLRNSAPEVEGDLDVTATVSIGVPFVFSVEVSDPDGDDVSLTLERNDASLFQMVVDESTDDGELSFVGSNATGEFVAWVSVTDGFSPVLLIARVFVVSDATTSPTTLMGRSPSSVVPSTIAPSEITDTPLPSLAPSSATPSKTPSQEPSTPTSPSQTVAPFTPGPSKAPSTSSTLSPTPRETDSPSQMPSKLPSDVPTSAPSSSPTHTSSESPATGVPSMLQNLMPIVRPIITPAIPLVIPVRVCTSSDPCDRCEGDCDSDAECKGELVCFQKGHGAPNVDSVAGCLGHDLSRTDWCTLPEFVGRQAPPSATPMPTPLPTESALPFDPIPLVKPVVRCTQDDPCGLCAGDCDSDADCEGDLICFQRDRGLRGERAVPGCIGDDLSRSDWCTHAMYKNQGTLFDHLFRRNEPLERDVDTDS